MINNFPLPNFEDGETILASEVNLLAESIHTVINSLIQDNDRALLLPAGFDGVNEIEAPNVSNSLLMIDASKRASVRSLTFFDDVVNNCGEQSASATQSAAAANDARAACVTILQQCQQILAEVQAIRSEVALMAGGASAYDIAVSNGFVGTQTQWLASLRGPSAYDAALAEGFVGTQAQWLASLKGADGDLTEAALPNTDAFKNLESISIAGL